MIRTMIRGALALAALSLVSAPALAQSAGTLSVKDSTGATQAIAVRKDASGNLYYDFVPHDLSGTPFGTAANPFNDNLGQIGGVAAATGAGASNTGTLRTILSSDSAVSLLAGAATIGAVNQGATPWVDNLTQIGGAAVNTGTGAAGTGTARVAVSTDSTANCVYNSTLPTATSGAAAPAQCDGNNNLRVRLTIGTGYPTAGSSSVGYALANNASGGGSIPLSVFMTAYNNSSSQTGPVFLDPNTNGIFEMAAPTANAAAGIAAATVAPSAASQVLKATAGNLYGLNIDNAAVSGTYVIDYNATAAPAAGAALTPALELWHYLLPSGASYERMFTAPLYASAGHVLLFSTSLTTFTAPGTLPVLSTGLIK